MRWVRRWVSPWWCRRTPPHSWTPLGCSDPLTVSSTTTSRFETERFFRWYHPQMSPFITSSERTVSVQDLMRKISNCLFIGIVWCDDCNLDIRIFSPWNNWHPYPETQYLIFSWKITKVLNEASTAGTEWISFWMSQKLRFPIYLPTGMITEEESVMTYNQFDKNYTSYQHPEFMSSFVDPEKRIFIIDPTAKVHPTFHRL